MISFFASPIGLGHSTRDIAMAGHLGDVSFVSGGGAARMLREADMKVRDEYDPPHFSVRGGGLRGRARWLWEYYNYYKRCRGIARRIIREDRPELVVSDEDFASVAEARDMGIPCVLVTDILETRFVRWPASMIERRMNRAMQEMVRGCDMIIMPEYGPDEGNIRRVGPIVRHTEKTREQARKDLGLDRKTVLITAGGTDAGRFLIEAALDAAADIDADVLVASGPSMQDGFPGARNLGFVKDLHEVIMAADVVVSLAGRSTIDEARAYGTPGIFIPVRGHFEQEDNAAREGYVHADIGRLGELVQEKLKEARGPADPGGAKKAAELIAGVAGSND